MKTKMNGIIALGALALSQLAFAGPELPPFAQKVDVIKVNQVISRLMTEVLAGDEIIEDAKIQMDPRHTDVDQYKAALIFDASARTTAWAPNQTSSVNLAAKIAPIHVTEDGIARTDLLARLQAGVHTDTLALTRFVAAKFTRDYQDCAEESRPEDQAACVEVHRLASADSLDTVATALQNLRAIALRYEKDEDLRKQFEAITIRKLGRQGQVTGLLVTYQPDAYFDLNDVLIKKIAVKMTAQSLQGAVTLQAKVEQEMLDSFKRYARAFLLQLQSEDPSRQTEVRATIRDYLEFAKAILTSSNN